MSIGANKSTAGHSWLWALLPLLLAAALVIPLLDVDAFNGDEPASLVLAAGICVQGPGPLPKSGTTPPRCSPSGDTPPGWGLCCSFFVGALRRLERVRHPGAVPLRRPADPYAWVYRAGRDFFAPAAGLIAALLLSASVFSSRLHGNADLYAPVALCAVICVRYYWRVPCIHSSQERRARLACCWAASACSIHIISAHCCSLPVLGLFHLLFVPKNRRWWRPVLLLADSPRWLPPAAPAFAQGGGNIQKAKTLAAASWRRP